MRHSIRKRISLAMIFLFVIILVLSVFSGYYLNKISDKTKAILKENYLSVIYARDMTEGITEINQEITDSYFTGRRPDSKMINNSLEAINKSLAAEKNNLTEPGEGKVVSDIEKDFAIYDDSLQQVLKFPKQISGILFLRNESGNLYQLLMLLSQMNGKAIEVKTDDAKASSKRALSQMTVLATVCFLIAISFIFSFATFFNQRISQLYNGIKQIVSSNYDQRLYFEGKDEFYEISLVFNEMAEKLKKNEEKLSVSLTSGQESDNNARNIEELREVLLKIIKVEEQAAAILSRFDKK